MLGCILKRRAKVNPQSLDLLLRCLVVAMRKVTQTPIPASPRRYSNQLPHSNFLIPKPTQALPFREPQFCAEKKTDGLSLSTDPLVLQPTAGQVNKHDRVLGSLHSGYVDQTERAPRQRRRSPKAPPPYWTHSHLNYFIIHLSLCVHTYTQVHTETTRRCQIPWGWACKQL